MPTSATALRTTSPERPPNDAAHAVNRPAAVDHIVYAVPDLDAATDDLEARLGVRPAYGGSHPGAGSHNALLDLADGVYLEVIAPDPNQPGPGRPRPFALDQLTEPRLVGWAAKATDLEARVEASRSGGYDPGDARAMSRRRPDGVLLEWTLTAGGPGADGLIPFLIDWGTAPHPGASAPGGCRLTALRGSHPTPDAIKDHLAALGVDLEVSEGPAALVTTLDTPNGPVELT